jgi:hypothetical protein
MVPVTVSQRTSSWASKLTTASPARESTVGVSVMLLNVGGVLSKLIA